MVIVFAVISSGVGGLGTTSGPLTIDGKLFSFTDTPGAETLTSTTTATTTNYYVYYTGVESSTNSVDWHVVTGPDGPALSDFTSATSGTFQPIVGTLFEQITLSLKGDSATPEDEQFQIELCNPSNGTVFGSMPSVTQAVDNKAGTTVCFAAGTRICTMRGDVRVEDLFVGDLVLASSGEMRPVRWLGHRTLDCRPHPRPRDVMPVCIAAHAFGANKPLRDLLVSPGHAICVDIFGEVLIPAISLVNGSAIVQAEVDTITYWHVELESHDIILAENLACESYLDMGNRGFFKDAAVIDLQAGPDAASRTHGDFCRPFHAAGALVEAARAWLDVLARYRQPRGRASTSLAVGTHFSGRVP